MILEVRDNGRGLPAPVEKIEEGMDLATLHYRADLMGATLEIKDGEEGGVTVACTLPTPSTLEGSALGQKLIA